MHGVVEVCRSAKNASMDGALRPICLSVMIGAFLFFFVHYYMVEVCRAVGGATPLRD